MVARMDAKIHDQQLAFQCISAISFRIKLRRYRNGGGSTGKRILSASCSILSWLNSNTHHSYI